MEDRYEIRGKIGQGGIGTVYRGYDMRMKREVAIKRILSSPEDPSLREEATKQLVVEAGALASLQHPHIVTVYDVGSDEDGPYVVMELISGKTLDEIIENAPLTWQDFRELAMQSQEALIAAQELDMIHSDLKPPNIMLTWLPSGKFQVKMVDFGLAVLTQNQSKEEIESMEAVFGSIFFMPPEQFERETLDARSDLYSLGCVYYQALTGIYPFNGETGTEVMSAHLNHTVTPIQDLRADIPLWACEWVMWHVNRQRSDRPQSSRDALSVFLQSDKSANPEMSRGIAQTKRPRLIIPGVIPSEPSTPDAPGIIGVPLTPPNSTTSVQLMAEEGHKSKTSPQALAPPDGSKPSVHTSPTPVVEPEVQSKVKTQPTPTLAATNATSQVYTSAMQNSDGLAKPKVPNSMKIIIAAALAVFVMIAAMMLKGRSEQNKRNEIYSRLVAQASVEGAVEVPMNAEELQILLDVVTSTGVVNERSVIYEALGMARATDGTDIDQVIVELVTGNEMLSDVREKLIGDVLKKRENPSMVPKLMAFAQVTTDVDAAVAAYDAVRNVVNDEHADAFLRVVSSSKHSALRRAAENNLAEIVSTSSNRGFLTKRIISSYNNARDAEVRHALIRLMGRCGTRPALDQITEALESDLTADQIAAAVALGSWEDQVAYDVLFGFLKKNQDFKVRDKVFDSLIRVSMQPAMLATESQAKVTWEKICEQAKLRSEKERAIRALVNLDQAWAVGVIQPYTSDSSSRIAELAKKGIERINERQQLRNN